MGSCCGKEEETSQYGEVNDRAHLIDTHDETIIACGNPSEHLFHIFPESKSKRLEEQSDISRIWQEMATNVIDVGTLGSHGLELHEYRERMTYYLSKLRTLSTSKLHWSLPKQCILVDIPMPDRALSSDISITDGELSTIIATLKDIDATFSDIKIKHKTDLVVPFRVSA